MKRTGRIPRRAGSLWPALGGSVAEAGASAAAGTVAADLAVPAAAETGAGAQGPAEYKKLIEATEQAHLAEAESDQRVLRRDITKAYSDKLTSVAAEHYMARLTQDKGLEEKAESDIEELTGLKVTSKTLVTRHGRRPGQKWSVRDEPIFEKMKADIEQGMTVGGAAQIYAPEAAGGGTTLSKQTRLRRHYQAYVTRII